MSRFFRAVAVTAAAAGGLSSAFSWNLSSTLRLSASPSSSPSAPIGPATVTGHLALVCAHPALLELNSILTPASFLVDSTQALLASALPYPPVYPEMLRHDREVFTEQILSTESDGHATAEQVSSAQTNLAFLDARDGRLEDTHAAVVRLAAEHPGNTC